MVESKSFSTRQTTALASVSASVRTADHADASSSDGQLFQEEFLTTRAHESDPQVQLWARRRLAELAPQAQHISIGRLLQSDDLRCQQVALDLIRTASLPGPVFPLLQLLRAGTHAQLPEVALLLSELNLGAAEGLLRQWCLDTLSDTCHDDDMLKVAALVRLRLEGASAREAYLRDLQSRKLPRHTRLALFSGLVHHDAPTAAMLREWLAVYRQVRVRVTGKAFLDVLIERASAATAVRYLQGYHSPKEAYRHALTHLLGEHWHDPAWSHWLTVLPRCLPTTEGLHVFMREYAALLPSLIPQSAASGQLQGFLRGTRSWANEWLRAPAALRELEHTFLLALPLANWLHVQERRALAAPTKHAALIARIYHSPLASWSFVRAVYALLDGKPQLKHTHPFKQRPIPREEEKESLWWLYSQFQQRPMQSTETIPAFARDCPEPWQYALPSMLEWIQQATEQAISQATAQQRDQHNAAVPSSRGGEPDQAARWDYYLSLCIHAPRLDCIPFLQTHITQLSRTHPQRLQALVERIPSLSWYTSLKAVAAEGDQTAAVACRFIERVHQLPATPCAPKRSVPQQVTSAPVIPPPQLLCPNCKHKHTLAAPYPPVYVNAQRLEQHLSLRLADLWMPAWRFCAHCGARCRIASVPAGLQRLSFQQHALAPFVLLPFPILAGQCVHPSTLSRRLRQHPPLAEQMQLRSALGQLQFNRGRLAAAKHHFQQLLTQTPTAPERYYQLGLIAFAQRHLHDAQLYFSQCLEHAGDLFDSETADFRMTQLAREHLRMLKQAAFKQGCFRVISPPPQSLETPPDPPSH